MLIDPSARTLEGFLSIVGREFTSMGHRFATRTGVGSGTTERGEQAPIFLIFLECVWQLQRQYPRAFEFGERLLLAMADASISGRWGTFAGDNDQEREALPNGGGPCFLAHVLKSRSTWVNRDYAVHAEPGMLNVSTDVRRLVLWHGYWLRYLNDGDQPTQHDGDEEDDAEDD